MGSEVKTCDVGIAITLAVDKLIRDTLKSLPYGHESIELLDSMFEKERDGWKLYHNPSIRWHNESDTSIRNLHHLLESIANDEKYDEEINYLVLHNVDFSEGIIDHHGGHEDPFNLGYHFRLEFDLEPAKPATPPTPEGSDGNEEEKEGESQKEEAPEVRAGQSRPARKVLRTGRE